MEKTELLFWAMAISFFVCVLTTISLFILNMISLFEASLIAALFAFVESVIAWRILKESEKVE